MLVSAIAAMHLLALSTQHWLLPEFKPSTAANMTWFLTLPSDVITHCYSEIWRNCNLFAVSFRMVGCTPFLTVSYFYLWFVPPFISGRFIWFLGFYCLYQTLITVSMTSVPDTGLTFQKSEMMPKSSHVVQAKNPVGKRRWKLWLMPRTVCRREVA